jgi:hypothetical protein
VPEEPPTWNFPLTGLPTEDESLTTKRVLSVKIENTSGVRPQSGIGIADVVYETLTEGGITRFNCIFQSEVPAEVGPVRSSRNSDISIVPEYRGLFFYAGGNDEVKAGLSNAGIPNMSYSSGASGLYYRMGGIAAPHNLWLRLGEAYENAASNGFDIESPDFPGLAYGPSLNSTAVPAWEIMIPFSSGSTAGWTWDPDSLAYLRSTDGAPHFDALTETQVKAENVVVLWASYTRAAPLDPAGGTTYNVNLAGSGDAAVFRGGQRIDGTWTSDGSGPPRFTDAKGVAITLVPGKTWFHVPNIGTTVTSSGPEPVMPSAGASASGGKGSAAEKDESKV